eukprot:scpid62352/ scgid11327/ 
MAYGCTALMPWLMTGCCMYWKVLLPKLDEVLTRADCTAETESYWQVQLKKEHIACSGCRHCGMHFYSICPTIQHTKLFIKKNEKVPFFGFAFDRNADAVKIKGTKVLFEQASFFFFFFW